MWWKINREGDCTRNEEPLLAAKCKTESKGMPIFFTNQDAAHKKRNKNARQGYQCFQF